MTNFNERLDEILGSIKYSTIDGMIPLDPFYTAEAKAKLQRLMVEARISDLSDLARNCNYASSAKKVDYVPVWRIESKIEVLTKELEK